MSSNKFHDMKTLLGRFPFLVSVQRNARNERKKLRNERNGCNGQNARIEAVSILALHALRWMATGLYIHGLHSQRES